MEYVKIDKLIGIDPTFDEFIMNEMMDDNETQIDAFDRYIDKLEIPDGLNFFGITYNENTKTISYPNDLDLQKTHDIIENAMDVRDGTIKCDWDNIIYGDETQRYFDKFFHDDGVNDLGYCGTIPYLIVNLLIAYDETIGDIEK